MNEPERQDLIDDARAPATKGDIASAWRLLSQDVADSYAATQKEIAHAERRLREEMNAMKREILHHFDAAVENIADELRGANADEISALKDTDNRLHERIVPLERQAGYESPREPHSPLS